MGSTRLPGKVLEEVAGRPLAEQQMRRMMRAVSLADVVVATTTSSADDPLVAAMTARGYSVFRGSEQDVLARYASVAATTGADPVVRMTMDCPLIDPAVIDQVLGAYRAGDYDFVTNNLEPTFPHGLDLEVFSRAALDAADREATALFEREHVSPFVRDRPERFRLGNVRSSRDLHHHRWTVDYPEDLALVRAIYDELFQDGETFTTDDVLTLLGRRPDILALNATRVAHVIPTP
jgi:spore coat polysaccharide biosynthesis protein SpsF